MNATTFKFLAPNALLALAALAGSLAAPLSYAQQVYRIVGPNGKVTFSDQAPLPASNANVSESSVTAAEGSASASLPFELRQVTRKYPVTLYTSNSCAPCTSARSLLTNRGIPFSEKTISTAQDSEALQRISGETSLPFLTIGSQQLKGFADAEWTQFLNAAGYPVTSILPPSYRPPAATPLVTVAPASVAAPNAAGKSANGSAPAVRPVIPQATTRDNPSGIRF